VDSASLYDNAGGVLEINDSDATLVSRNNAGALSDSTVLQSMADYTLHLHGYWDGNQA
jgi:hypothetical protein